MIASPQAGMSSSNHQQHTANENVRAVFVPGNPAHIIFPANDIQAIINHPHFKESCCTICLEPMHLSERVIKLAVCQHIFHDRCFEKWADTHESYDIKCPLCAQPAARNSPHWDETSKAFIFKIKKAEINRPEPFISPPVHFSAHTTGHATVEAALAFKGLPAVAAWIPDSTETPDDPAPSTITVITDRNVVVLDAESISGTTIRKDITMIVPMVLLPTVIVENIKSSVKRKLLSLSNHCTRQENNPKQYKPISISIDPTDDDDERFVTKLTPGLPIKSALSMANAISFLLHTATLGAGRRRFFEDPEQYHSWGERLDYFNFQPKSMKWLPPVISAASDLNTDSPHQAHPTTEQTGVSDPPPPAPWSEQPRLDLMISYDRDGQNPFARLKGLTFNLKKPNGCIKEGFLMDQSHEPDDAFEQYQNDFFNGVKLLKKHESFYVYLKMAAEPENTSGTGSNHNSVIKKKGEGN